MIQRSSTCTYTYLRVRLINTAQEDGVRNDQSDAEVDENGRVMRFEIPKQKFFLNQCTLPIQL